jgi:DNA repair protein RadC
MTAKFKAGESAGTYITDAPVTEADIVEMAQHLASKRLRKGQDYEHEVFALLLLDSKHRVIRFEELFRGTLDSASVYPREIVKVALEHNAAAIVLVHNHPSGDPEPSHADRVLTSRLKQALEMVGVRTLDHIIVGAEGCVSLAELNQI